MLVLGMLDTRCFRAKTGPFVYFIISLLWQLQIAWKFPEVHRRCCLLWIWYMCSCIALNMFMHSFCGHSVHSVC